MTAKKRRRHTSDQIIRMLAGHKQLATGKELDEVCRPLEIGESTLHRWLAQHGFSGQLWSFHGIGAQQDASNHR